MDLTVLISTIISTSAALTAIIGGFLVSRTITLNSERSNLLKRIQEIDNELTYKEKILKQLNFQIFEDEADDFIRNHAEEVLVNHKSIQSILEKYNYSLTVEEIEWIVKKIQKIFNEIMKLIENDTISSLPSEFKTFKENKNMTIEKYESWYEEVYTIIYREKLKTISSNYLLLRNNYSMLHSVINTPSKELLRIKHERFKEKNYLQDEIQILNGLKKELTKILKSYSARKELKYGFIVFIYNSIVGIVIPSMLLPYPLNTYDDVATKQLLLGLFLSELIVLFIYLGISIYQLVQSENQSEN